MVNVIVFTSIFLNIFKRCHPLNENLICFFYKTLMIYTLFCKGNMLNNKGTPYYMNQLFIPYYIYSIFNHLDFSMIDIYMIVHHLCALNFLSRSKYSPYSVNFLHGNLVLADYPNVISELYYKIKNEHRNENNEIVCDSFFIFYKLIFGIMNSYILCRYNLNNNFRDKLLKNMVLKKSMQHKYCWDLMSNFTMVIMYIAIIFKIKTKLKNNQIFSNSLNSCCILSFFIINYKIIMSRNNGQISNISLGNYKIGEDYSNFLKKTSKISLVIYYYNKLMDYNILKLRTGGRNLSLSNKKFNFKKILGIIV